MCECKIPHAHLARVVVGGDGGAYNEGWGKERIQGEYIPPSAPSLYDF